MKSSKLVFSAALILALVVVVNMLLSQFSLRFDLTEDKQYTLSKATKNILKELTEPVTIKAYFSQGLKPEIAKTQIDFREILQEYSELSGGMLVYEFLDPNEEDAIMQEALQSGIQPVTISVREKNESSQQQAFMGALIQMGEDNEVIPFLQPGAPIEYALTSNIKKLAVLDKPSIGLIQGHGEPSIGEIAQVQNSLSILYQLEPLTLGGDPIPEKYNTLALVRPIDSIPPFQLQQLDDFLGRGGKLFIGLNRVNGDLTTSQGTEITTGLESWLKEKGVEVLNNFVADASCGSVSVRQQRGFFQMMNQIKFPYLPIIQKFADHPITKGLEAVILQFSSEVKFSGDSSLTFTPIAFSSANSGTSAPPLFFDIQKKWTDRELPRSGIPVAAVLEGNIVGNRASKMVVVGDGDFAVNGSQQQFQQQQPDNISLMVNSIDWLSDDTGLIDLRTKGVASRPINDMEESKQNTLRYLNFFAPIFLVLIYGFYRTQRRKDLRMKRMQERFVD